jgi:hypothetical protein
MRSRLSASSSIRSAPIFVNRNTETTRDIFRSETSVARTDRLCGAPIHQATGFAGGV